MKSKHPESMEHPWKADLLTRAPIDAMEMQIYEQILSRMGVRETENKRERERERQGGGEELGKCKKLRREHFSVVFLQCKVDRFSLYRARLLWKTRIARRLYYVYERIDIYMFITNGALF